MEDGLTVAQMSERSGTSAHTLRYYEREGLLAPVERNGGGHRRYREGDLAALTFLGHMRATGMGIAKLREYMTLAHLGDAYATRRRTMLEAHRATVLARRAELDACLAVVDRKIAMCLDVESSLHQGKENENENACRA